jgi:hypothetical protein
VNPIQTLTSGSFNIFLNMSFSSTLRFFLWIYQEKIKIMPTFLVSSTRTYIMYIHRIYLSVYIWQNALFAPWSKELLLCWLHRNNYCEDRPEHVPLCLVYVMGCPSPTEQYLRVIACENYTLGGDRYVHGGARWTCKEVAWNLVVACSVPRYLLAWTQVNHEMPYLRPAEWTRNYSESK